jgi:hypothetical protein
MNLICILHLGVEANCVAGEALRAETSDALTFIHHVVRSRRPLFVGYDCTLFIGEALASAVNCNIKIDEIHLSHCH